MVARFSTLPLLASVVPGLWHSTQNWVSTRPPPCSASLPWQPLQEATSVILRVLDHRERRGAVGRRIVGRQGTRRGNGSVGRNHGNLGRGWRLPIAATAATAASDGNRHQAGHTALNHQALHFFSVTFCYTTYRQYKDCLLYTSPSPRDRQKSRMPSSA